MNKFLTNTYKNRAGITVIDSGKLGKNIGIFAVTHGNEPVGINIFEYLVEVFDIAKNLKKGKLFLIANNIKAYKKYLETKDINNYRFLDDNMNRISNQKHKKGSYEFERFEELKTIYDEIDIAIDLHSVPKGNDVIGICDTGYLQTAKEFFDVETILSDDMGTTGAIIGEFLRNNKVAYGIECGNHMSQYGLEKGKINILNFLQYYGAIDNHEIINHYEKSYEFLEEIKVENNHIYFTKECKGGFTKIKPGKMYAMDGEKQLVNNFSHGIYVGIPAKNPKKGDGAGFLFQKI